MASFDIQSVTDEHFMHSLIEELTTQCGEIRFTKLIHVMIWVAFVSNEKALEAVKLGPLTVSITKYFELAYLLADLEIILL